MAGALTAADARPVGDGWKGGGVAHYLRTLARHAVDGIDLGSISTTTAFGAVAIAVHTAPEANWNWQGDSEVRSFTAIIFVLRGEAIFRSIGPVEVTATSGDALLLHSQRTAEVAWASGSSFLVLLVPTDAIVGSGIDTDALPVTFERTPLLAATRAFALALGNERGPAARFSAYVSERLLAEMAFGLVLEGRESGPGMQRGSLADRARTIMIVRRAEPDLSASSIAADLHVSVRQLQRAFAQDGLTPGAVLRQVRVELAESMLRDPQFDGLSIDQVAQFSGFASASSMRRAFEAEGIAAPRVVRRARERVAV